MFVLGCLINFSLSAQSVPYNVNKHKFPLGEDFRKILPERFGDWERFAFHDFIPGREDGSVFYEKGSKEIHVEFGKAQDQEDMKIIWGKLYDNATEKINSSDIKLRNNSSVSNRLLLIQGNPYYFAWTRNLYYFSVSGKSKTDVDDFMKTFPW